jgi:hypothetical protein
VVSWNGTAGVIMNCDRHEHAAYPGSKIHHNETGLAGVLQGKSGLGLQTEALTLETLPWLKLSEHTPR